MQKNNNNRATEGRKFNDVSANNKELGAKKGWLPQAGQEAAEFVVVVPISLDKLFHPASTPWHEKGAMNSALMLERRTIG